MHLLLPKTLRDIVRFALWDLFFPKQEFATIYLAHIDRE